MLKQLEELRDKYNNKFRNSNDDLSEASTEKIFIDPFLSALGYDPGDPDLVKVQFKAVSRGIKGAKVDYALHREGSPIMYVESKRLRSDLRNIDYIDQISLYFSSKKEVEFVILTNGYEYRFFTDLKDLNILDSEPFRVFNLNEINQELVEGFLSLFTPENFDSDTIKQNAYHWKLEDRVYTFLKNEFSNPSGNFLSFISKSVLGNAKKKSKQDVKKALCNIVLSLNRSDFKEIPIDPSPAPITKSDPKEEKNIFEIQSAKHKNLEYFRFQKDVIKVKDWAEMYVYVFKSLCELGKSKLMEISRDHKGLKINNNPDLIKAPKEISNGLYISAWNDTDTKIRYLKKALEAFNMKDALFIKLKN
ncbi:MAG: type I restriction endonuclease [Bacteroidetes bacterium]|nr:type I restriction endonuclease [Bacteroidota bacterium]